MRPHRRRGDSFNVGKVNNRIFSDRGNPLRLEQTKTSGDLRRSFPSDTGHDRKHNDNHRLPSFAQHKGDVSENMRKRTEGTTAHGSSSVAYQLQSQKLLSIKSSPNLTKEDAGSGNAPLQSLDSSWDERQIAKSSPNLLDNVNSEQYRDAMYSPSMSRDFDYNAGQGGYGNYRGKTFSSDMYCSGMTSPRQNMRRSMPAYTLQRYQPDYENVSHLGTAPLGSEKISEIDDIDEEAGKDSNPHTPEIKAYDPLSGAGPPTRDPASLKYIKVNQNHEKYPSWPVTAPNGATEQTQPINSRAQSMTDHTNTSKEFPRKQQLAYTPGLRPLAEKNSPTSERKIDDGNKSRNGSDPGFKMEFVYDRLGRVQRRNVDKREGMFDNFYNNSKPGYPPPSMDPDGHNLGDKEYNAPSPPERDGRETDRLKFTYGVRTTDDPNKSGPGDSSIEALRSAESARPLNTATDSTGANPRPSQLNFHVGGLSPSSNTTRSDSGNSPLEKGSPLFNFSQREMLQSGGVIGQHNKNSPLQERRRSSPMHSWQERGPQPSRSQNSPSHSSIGSKLLADHEWSSSHGLQKDRPSSHDLGKAVNTETNKAYIVKSTPYYNTSTQTEIVPYAIKLSDPASSAARLKHAETQVGGSGTQTSPKKLEEQRKLFDEKSIQARMSKDFQTSELNIDHDTLPSENKSYNEGFFKYPTTVLNTRQSSSFKGIQSIQAKYSTDEVNDMADENKSVIPNFGDNASILRKLSEEFYGHRLGMMPEKRISSASSQESPRFDPEHPVVQQLGMREAGSYSSVVIHHEEKSGPFGRDDFGSVSSIAESRHYLSSAFSDTGSNYKNIDTVSARGRSSLDTSFNRNQKATIYHHNPRKSSSVGHSREMSAPVPGSFHNASGYHQPLLGSSGKIRDAQAVSSISSGSSVLSSKSSSDTRSPRSTPSGSGMGSPTVYLSQLHSNTISSPTTALLSKQVSLSKDDLDSAKVGSDSVFIDDDKEPPEDYEFNRKPSMRKAYGIYDETERLISQAKVSDKSKPTTEHRTASPSDGVASNAHIAMPRGSRYSESQSLGKIQEESDMCVTGSDLGDSDHAKPVTGKLSSAGDIVAEWKKEKVEKYPWQNEAWLRSKVGIPKGTNLKRATSEQIAFPKENVTMKTYSHDTDSGRYQRSGDTAGTNMFASPTPLMYSSKHFSGYRSSDSSSMHSRTQSDDLARTNMDLQFSRLQQLEASRFNEHIGDSLGSEGSSVLKGQSSMDSSLYESIGGDRSTSDLVADVINMVTENLAKSAKRVDSIRRSNSSSSRGSLDYVDMTRQDRSRKETDWTRLRSLGSLRYSPDQDRPSCRSSFASENLYEDISVFAPSTPRSSLVEGRDTILESGISDASMDSGLVISPTYQNLPVPKRPPPLPPRSPSPEMKPPALPPRRYRENQPLSTEDKPVLPETSSPLQTPSSAASEKNRMNVIPLNKQPNEVSQVDRSKRDFKSLMSQWENSSPREDRYAAELRKQAKKFSGNQQQINAMPATYERTKPTINVATTYKHEPMQPQEATPPTTSTHPSSSGQVFTTASVSSSLPATAISSLSSQPPSGFQPLSYKSNSLALRQQTGPPAPKDSTVSPTRNVSANTAQSNLTERILPDDSRMRSSSDVVHSKPLVTGNPNAAKNDSSLANQPFRGRSSTEHDILSGSRPNYPPQQPGVKIDEMNISKWRPGRGGPEIPPPQQQAKSSQPVEIVSMREGELPPRPMLDPEDGLTSDNDGFADESYIGHKNKSSRAIGTYKRSKSAVLQSNNNTIQSEADKSFQEARLGQQSWSSESVLSRTEASSGAPVETMKDGSLVLGNTTEYGSDSSQPVPVRPARPSLHSRRDASQQSPHPHDLSPASSTPFTPKPFAADHPANGVQRESPRRAAPIPFAEPSYDPNSSPVRGKIPHISDNQQWSNEDIRRDNLNSTKPQHSPQRMHISNDISIVGDALNLQSNRNAAASSPSSSQDEALQAVPGDKASANGNTSGYFTQREYQRRESAPMRSNPSDYSPENKPIEDQNGVSRRRSEGGANLTQRSEHTHYDIPPSSHSRQPSQEELECDEKAMQLVQELEDRDQKLSQVLKLDANKKRMKYMDGLFSESLDATSFVDRPSYNPERRSSMKTRGHGLVADSFNEKPDSFKSRSLPKEYWKSPSKAMLEMELRGKEDASKELIKDINDSGTLMKHKEELLEKLHRKLEVLKEEKLSLQNEIADNNMLGKQVCQAVDSKCQSPSEKDKLKAHIEDLEKIVRLLLNLSGQLARAQNAVQALGADADTKVKKLTIEKRERLFAKHEEAKLLKEDIDKRSDQLSSMLRDRLDEREFSDYTHFIKMKSKLTIELQELDDKITLGEEQISELRKSIPDVSES